MAVLQPEAVMARYLERGVRPDGRDLSACRPLSIQCVPRAGAQAGHAAVRVQNGGSSALAALTPLVTAPLPLTPNAGGVGTCWLRHTGGQAPCLCALSSPAHVPLAPPPLLRRPTEIAVHAGPLVHRSLPSGRSSALGLSLSHQLTEMFQRSGAVDLAGLCIVRDAAVWMLKIDVLIESQDGALLDVAAAAVASVLAYAQLPAVLAAPGERVCLAGPGSPDTEHRVAARPIPLQSIPVCLSSVVVQGKWLADPSAEEDALASGHASMAVAAPLAAAQRSSQGADMEIAYIWQAGEVAWDDAACAAHFAVLSRHVADVLAVLVPLRTSIA